MKILVFSDSHGNVSNMLRAVEREMPRMILHLGDCWRDGERLHDAFPAIEFHQVPGNCDAYREPAELPQILQVTIGGVKLYLTHGHHHNPDNLPPLPEGTVFLSGHTHVKIDEVHNGIGCLNPGSVSIPKDGSHSCLIFDKGAFRFHIWEA